MDGNPTKLMSFIYNSFFCGEAEYKLLLTLRFYVSNLVVLTSCLRHNISSRDPPWGGRGAKPYGIMADDGLV